MANYEIYENYNYDENVRKLENTDPASADGTFNPLFSQLVNNIHSLKLTQDSIDSNINIIDDLESNSSDSALSANQGRVLDEKITAQNTTLTSAINTAKVTVVNNLDSTFGTSALSAYQGNVLDGKIANNPAQWGTGRNSSTAGYENFAEDNYSSAYGSRNRAESSFSSAFGYENIAEGASSTAFGRDNITSGTYSGAFGTSNAVNAGCSNVFGRFIVSDTYYCTVIGLHNATTNGSATTYSSTSDGFVVGIGYSTTSLKNGLRITNSGLVYGGTYYNSGADYAEYFEWLDGNIENIDRIGLFVCIEDGKIKLAESSDDFIIGAVSGGTCSIIGDAQADEWHGKYTRDIFGRLEYEWIDVEHDTVTGIDDDGNEITEKEIKQEYHMKLNPFYDPENPYVPRAERQEWDVIGLLGKLILIDDGTCSVGDYCTAGIGGIATKSLNDNGFMVLERLDDSHIKILKI